MTAERRTDLACALLLIIVPAILFADVLFLGTGFYARDLYTYHFPMKHIVRETIAHGEFPSWNRYFFGGQPLAANPAYEVFYPPQWLIFIGSYPFGFALHILAHVWLALLGMYALLRSLPLRAPASLFGALSFGLSAFLLGTTTNLPTMFVWSWAPLVAWSLLRLARQPDAVRFAIAAPIGAMPLLVAEPSALLGIAVLIGTAAIAWAPRRLPLLALSGLTSAVIAAIQLLPMIDFARDTPRAHGFPFDVVSDWSMPPLRIVELLGIHYSGAFPRGVPYLPSIYAGVLVIVFAIAGFALRSRGALVTAIVVCLSFLLAIGNSTPLLSILYRAGMRSLRYPEKFIAIAIVALIVFASTVVDRVQRKELLWAIVLVALADNAIHADRIAPRMPRLLFTAPPVARAVGREAVVFPRGRWTGGVIGAELNRAAGPWFQRNALYPLTPAAWDIRMDLQADIDETALNVTHDLLAEMQRTAERDERWSERFMSMAGVQYVIDYRPFDDVMREARGDVRIINPVRIRRVPNRGRYYLVPDGPPPRVQETSHAATIDVDTPVPASLVVTVTRHKYWSATVDGKPAPILPANIAYQAIAIPAGRHRVEMRYSNPLFAWGACISAAALIAITAPTLRRRRPRSGS